MNEFDRMNESVITTNEGRFIIILSRKKSKTK